MEPVEDRLMSHPLTAALDSTLSPAVVAFCTREGLLEHLRRALALAESRLRPSALVVELEADPETDEEAVVITAVMSTSADEVLRRKQEYTRRWVESTPPAARERIRLLFDIV
jgi:hypothetical protein